MIRLMVRCFSFIFLVLTFSDAQSDSFSLTRSSIFNAAASEKYRIVSSHFHTHVEKSMAIRAAAIFHSEQLTNYNRRTIKDVPGDLFTAGRIFVGDFIYVYSSPLRWNWRNVAWFGGFAALTAVIYVYDQEILDFIKENNQAFIIKPILDIGNFFEPIGHMGNTNKFYFGGLAVGYIFDIKPLTTITAQILESFFIASTLKLVSKRLIGRKRPFEGEGPYSFSLNGGTSFPSGHALNIFQLATITSHHFKFLPYQIFAYVVATGIALQRVESDNHWPSDVLFSAVFGTLVSRTVLKAHENRKVSVQPKIIPENHYQGLSLVINLN